MSIHKQLALLSFRLDQKGDATVLYADQPIPLISIGHHGLFAQTKDTWLPISAELGLELNKLLINNRIAAMAIYQAFHPDTVFVDTADSSYYVQIFQDKITPLPCHFNVFYLNLAMLVSDANIIIWSPEKARLFKVAWSRPPLAQIQIIGVYSGCLIVRHDGVLKIVSFSQSEESNQFDVADLPLKLNSNRIFASLEAARMNNVPVESAKSISEALDSSALLKTREGNQYVLINSETALVLKVSEDREKSRYKFYRKIDRKVDRYFCGVSDALRTKEVEFSRAKKMSRLASGFP